MGLLVWPSECGYPTQDIMHVDIHHRVLCMWISTTGYYVCGYPPQGIILPTPPTPAEYFISSSSNTSHPRSTPSSRTQPPRWQFIWSVSQTNRKIASGTAGFKWENDYTLWGQCSADTRADTMRAGATFVLLESNGQFCDITGIFPNLASIKNIPSGTTATAYDHINGTTCIMLVPKNLYFGD